MENDRSSIFIGYYIYPSLAVFIVFMTMLIGSNFKLQSEMETRRISQVQLEEIRDVEIPKILSRISALKFKLESQTRHTATEYANMSQRPPIWSEVLVADGEEE